MPEICRFCGIIIRIYYGKHNPPYLHALCGDDEAWINVDTPPAFSGITIRIYYDDHNPPHFHALYGNDEAWININTLVVFGGSLPSRALDLVIKWASSRQDELCHDWELAIQQQKPQRISPLK